MSTAPTRSYVAKQAADKLTVCGELLTSLASRLATADALEAEGAMDILQVVDQHLRLVYSTAHLLARGTLPESD
jgi:hypothetical protein